MGGAPVYVTHAVATPMHVRVRNGLPFHLCYVVTRVFLRDIFFFYYDGIFCFYSKVFPDETKQKENNQNFNFTFLYTHLTFSLQEGFFL